MAEAVRAGDLETVRGQIAAREAMAPHLWLSDSRSTLDLFDRGMVLLAGGRGSAWARAEHEQAANVPLDAQVGGDGFAARPGRFEKLYGITPEGAVLVRPDGFVAWRAPAAVADTSGELRRALDGARQLT
jgi:putative polyketide hydroxylase